MWTKPAVFLLVSLMSLSAAAFTPDLKALEDMTLVTRYPQGSLVSRESAEHALSEVKKAQSRLKEQADYAYRRCEENFFVNSCRDDVREARIRQERRLFQIEKEARGVIRSFNAKEEAARQAERDKKAKTAQKPDAKLGTALSKRAQESKARQKAAEARKAKEAANRAKYELKQKKKAERIKAREEALAKRRAKEAAKAARGK